MKPEEAQELLDNLRLFDLPEEFTVFQQTAEFDLTDGVKMTLRLPNAMDLEWASSESNRVAVARSALLYSYIPRIIAATVTHINGVPLHKLVRAGKDDSKLALHERMRQNMKYAAYCDSHQVVYESLIGRIPFDVLKDMYYNGGVDAWHKTCGGLIEPVTSEELQQKAEGDLAQVADSAEGQQKQ